MFARRVFASAGIPRSMYASLNINTAAQASRLLPGFIPLTGAYAHSVRSFSLTQSSLVDTTTLTNAADMDLELIRTLLDNSHPVQVGFLRLLELWGIRPVRVFSVAMETKSTSMLTDAGILSNS